MSNFTATPAAVANALVTAAFGVAAQAYQLRQGTITEEDFIVNSEVLCLDVSVSAVASILGQTLIPIPVLGAVLGNMAGMFMYQIAKDHLSSKEQSLIQNYQKSFAVLNKMLEEQYQQLISKLKKELAKYGELKKSIGNVSQKVLTSQLRQMEESGLLIRTVFPEVPPRVEYTLTELGQSLKPVLDAMWNWGEEYKAKNA